MIIKASFSPVYSDLQEDIINAGALNMSHHMDNSILRECLISDGWNPIIFHGSPLTPYGQLKISEWCKSNIKDSDWAYLDGFLFKNKEDLLMFNLTFG
jgi:hypothetical protein